LAIGSGVNIVTPFVNPKNTAVRESFLEWEVSSPAAVDLDNLRARLLANENPHGPSDKTKLAIYDTVSKGNRYGHGYAKKLIEKIALKEGVTPDHIILGPGSSDLLEKTAVSLFMKGGNIVSADPAYMSLIKSAEAMQATWKPVPLKKDWSHDLPAMEAAIDSNTQLVYICNPNNPTGTITPASDLWSFCKEVSKKMVLFVDEAYLEFMEAGPEKKSMVGLIKEGSDIIVARTFSKVHGMAGLRVGYIVGQPETLEKINATYRANMGMNIASMMGALTSMDDKSFIENSIVWNKASRDYVCAELKGMGFSYLPSHTSFVLFPIEMKGKAFLKKMFELGIGVRAFMVHGQDYCRVSMGTMPEMKMFVESLKEVLT